MLYGMYVSAAGAMVNSYRQDVVANNLANVETTGFKKDLALVQERRTEAQDKGQKLHTTALLEGLGGGLFALPTSTDYSPASLDKTGAPLDVAINGKGFFQLQNTAAPGNISFTRDGRFTIDSQNQIVSIAQGLPLLNQDGQPIIINPDQAVDINLQGVISQEGQAVAQLGVVDFQDTSILRKSGKNQFVTDQANQAQVVQTPVMQGALENSGVDAITEMTNMIQIQREFQANINMLKIQDQTLALAVSRLGTIS